MDFNRFLNTQTKTVTGAAGILVFSALISRILGLIRNWLLASIFGAGSELDIYFAAFRIPDLVYNILIAGGVIVAFLPLFSEYFNREREKAWEFTNNLLNIFLFFLVLISLVLFIFTPELIRLIAPGFDFEKANLAILLTRLMFLSPILFGVSSIFSGILQYFNRFLVYSLCPILYNLGIILGIIFLAPFFGILGVAIGVVLGAFFYLIIQIPSAISCGFKYRPIFNFRDPGIKRAIGLMIPRTFGIAANQVNLIVITAIASTLAAGSIAIFNFANNLQYFPVGIIGISFAIAVFPALSRDQVRARKENFLKNFSSAFRQVLYLIIPISFLVFILREQIVRVILSHGQFSLTSSKLTAASLGLFSLGIFALSLIPLIFRAFFALQNTKIPALIAILGMIINISLCFILVRYLQVPNPFQTFLIRSFSLDGIKDISVIGLPLAFSLASISQFILLLIFLYKEVGDFKIKEIFSSFLKIFLASVLMAIVSYFILHLLTMVLKGQTLLGVFWQLLAVSLIGSLVYVLATFVLKSPEIKSLKLAILKLRK